MLPQRSHVGAAEDPSGRDDVSGAGSAPITVPQRLQFKSPGITGAGSEGMLEVRTVDMPAIYPNLSRVDQEMRVKFRSIVNPRYAGPTASHSSVGSARTISGR